MRPRSWLAAGLLLSALLGAWLLWRGEEEITNYPSQGEDIIAFGDSLVEGVGATPGNDFVSLLSQRLGRPIVNLGRSGDTTEDGLARLNELDAYLPKVVILLLGGNDYLRRVPAEETFANLQKIVDDIHGRGAIVLLLGIRGGLLRDNFAAQFKELSELNRTAYVHDVLDELVGNPSYMADQIHPNDAGYRVIAGRVAPVLERLLNE